MPDPVLDSPDRIPVSEDLRDAELAEAVKRGQTEGLRFLVERHSKKAYWTAYNILHSHEDAQDVSQEAFIRIFRFINRYDSQQRFTTWLYQIVVNLSIDSLRRRKGPQAARLDSVPEAASERLGPQQEVELLERRHKVHEVLAGLPDQYRIVLVLRDIEGQSSREVARILEMNHATVRWRLHRARALFKEVWESRYGGESGV